MAKLDHNDDRKILADRGLEAVTLLPPDWWFNFTSQYTKTYEQAMHMDVDGLRKPSLLCQDHCNTETEKKQAAENFKACVAEVNNFFDTGVFVEGDDILIIPDCPPNLYRCAQSECGWQGCSNGYLLGTVLLQDDLCFSAFLKDAENIQYYDHLKTKHIHIRLGDKIWKCNIKDDALFKCYYKKRTSELDYSDDDDRKILADRGLEAVTLLPPDWWFNFTSQYTKTFQQGMHMDVHGLAKPSLLCQDHCNTETEKKQAAENFKACVAEVNNFFDLGVFVNDDHLIIPGCPPNLYRCAHIKSGWQGCCNGYLLGTVLILDDECFSVYLKDTENVQYYQERFNHFIDEHIHIRLGDKIWKCNIKDDVLFKCYYKTRTSEE
jgi:ribosomal protein L37AE/L43A